MTAGAMLTHLTKPFDTSGKSAARRYHRGACDRWALAKPVEAGAIQRHARAEASGEAEGRQEEDAAVRQGRHPAGSVYRGAEGGQLMRMLNR